MPRLRPDAPQRRGEIITNWQRHHNVPDPMAAKMIGMSLTTFKRRRKLGDWAIDELHRAIRAFHIPAQDALDLLTVGCYPMEQFMEKEKRKKYGNHCL
jgi:hypothetical protein